MKRAVIIFFIVLAGCNSGKENAAADKNKLPVSLVNNPHTAGGLDAVAAADKPTMDFADTLHDFGAIHEDEVVAYEFSYTNHGKTPLIVTAAIGSCGCTVPDFSSEPLPPGQSRNMKVTFNSSGKSGHQEKSVQIHDNSLRGEHMLFIKADILKPSAARQ